jgi:hypothetical protein
MYSPDSPLDQGLELISATYRPNGHQGDKRPFSVHRSQNSGNVIGRELLPKTLTQYLEHAALHTWQQSHFLVHVGTVTKS